MTIKELFEIRNNDLLRDNFLVSLAKRNRQNIFNTSRRLAGNLVTNDLVHNECTQYFMLGANRAIDKANIIDDGRGQNDPEGYCVTLGIFNVKDFLIREFRLDRKHRPEFVAITAVEYNIGNYDQYESDIINRQIIEEIIQKLKPLDRKILQLIMYGEVDNKVMVPIVQNNRVCNSLVDTIARTLDYSPSYIQARMHVLRGVFATLPLERGF
jgi:hypothetical protein